MNERRAESILRRNESHGTTKRIEGRAAAFARRPSRRYHVGMLERLKRILAREIDVPVLVRTLAAAVVLAIAFALSWYGYYSRWRHDLEVATSVLVIGVLAYGIYAALNAGRFERAEAAGDDEAGKG